MKSPIPPTSTLLRLVCAAALLGYVLPANAQTPEIVHRFNNTTNFALGALPVCSPFFDTDGTMYGTCSRGGTGEENGTVWKRTPAGVVSRVGAFSGGAGGRSPDCGVLKGADGNFYGTNPIGPGFTFKGTAYRLTLAGAISEVVNWTGSSGANPGSQPLCTSTRGPGGVIYGSCLTGGAGGFGTLWRINADGSYNLLHEMTNTSQQPQSLAIMADGTLFFTGGGKIFKRTTAGLLSEVRSSPHVMGMVASSDGNLYGISYDGAYELFSLTQEGAYTTLQTLPNSASGLLNNTYCRRGEFVEASDGNFYTMNTLQMVRLGRSGSFTALPRPAPNSGGTTGLAEGPDGYIYGIVADDDGTDPAFGGAIFRVALQASAPEIALEQPAGTDLVGGTASIGYGTVNTGSSVVKTFTIKNTGTGALTVTGASVTGGDTGDFTVNTTGMSGSVGAGSSTTFTVTFTPTAAGARTTTLQIANNDADEAPFDITLTGTGNVPLDGDTDGLPDAWEIVNFGSAGAASGTVDSDNDGLNNFGEYAFGLNPNSSDLSALPQATRTGGLMTLTVTKQPHAAYTIVASTDLSAGSFSTAGLTIVTDNATTLTVRETAAGTRRFMQVRAVPAP